jgi:Uma2 family endonuclease
MSFMSTRSANYKDAIAHLPEASVLLVEDVGWDEYETLLHETADSRPGVHLTYDHGRLQIVTTSRRHEKYKAFIEGMVRILADKYQLSVESSGGATWKRERDARGTEADTCFHIGNVGRVIGKDELNLDTDPPPDLVIEIDVSNQSESKFPIYAAFGVPEIWRYIAKKKLLQIYELRNNRYEEVNASKSFAILTHDVLADFLEKSSACGQTQALSDFREWLRVSDQDRLLNK